MTSAGRSHRPLPASPWQLSLRVGACQTPEMLGDIEHALVCIEDFAAEAHVRGVDLLVFPECFLQGYLVEEQHLSRHALGLGSAGLPLY